MSYILHSILLFSFQHRCLPCLKFSDCLLRLRSELPFRFKGQVVNVLRTDNAFSLPGSTSPALAYINLRTISALREEFILGPHHMTRTKRNNWPMTRLRLKRLRSIQPAQKTKDPYIIALLIALAQAQRLGHGNPTEMAEAGSGSQVTESNPTSFKVGFGQLGFPPSFSSFFSFPSIFRFFPTLTAQ